MSNIVVDDTSTNLTYSGVWTPLTGSSRQWNSTVHSTFQTGATVSFQFQGSVCLVYGTVPAGNGSTVLMDVTIDGSVSPIVSQNSSSTPVYAFLFYNSSSMQSIWHNVTITNKGGAGNLDFEFDRVELEANDIVPSVAPWAPASMTTSAASSTLPTGAVATTRASSSSAHTVLVGGIVGGVIGFLILLLLVFFCFRRWKVKIYRFALMGTSSNKTTKNMSQNLTAVAAPFTLRPSGSADLNSPSQLPLFSTPMTQKVLRQQSVPSRPENNSELASTPTLSSLPIARVFSVSAPGTHATDSVEALTLEVPPADISPLGESVPLQHSSGATSIAIAGDAITASIYDIPPAYRPSE